MTEAREVEEVRAAPPPPAKPCLVTREAILEALQAWAATQGLSWDEENQLPEPVCGGCTSPINVWDGEDACPDCDDCLDCCWDNHAGEPHAPEVRQ